MLILSFYFPLTTFTLIPIQIYVHRIIQIYLFFNKRFLLFITHCIEQRKRVRLNYVSTNYYIVLWKLVTIIYHISGGRLDRFGRYDALKRFSEHIFGEKINFIAGFFKKKGFREKQRISDLGRVFGIFRLSNISHLNVNIVQVLHLVCFDFFLFHIFCWQTRFVFSFNTSFIIELNYN